MRELLPEFVSGTYRQLTVEVFLSN